MKCRSRHRGFALIEMIVTLALVTVAMDLGARLAMRLLTVGRDLAVGEQAALAIDRAAQTLRHDVERADAITATPNGVALGVSAWTVEPSALVRTDADGRVLRFDGLASPALSSTGGMVRLRIADADWAWRPLVNAGGPR